MNGARACTATFNGGAWTSGSLKPCARWTRSTSPAGAAGDMDRVKSEGSSDPTSDWPAIRYRDFYDVPRAVVVEWQGSLYLFDCLFDHDVDDYEPAYVVSRVPNELRDRIDEVSWTDLGHRSEHVGVVPTADVEFDATYRRRINPAVFDRLTER